MKKSPARPKVGMPKTNDFNEIVGLDLKVLSGGKGYILWCVDLFTKLIKGTFIRDKQPMTIIKAIISSWIVGGGFGPGHPSRGFYADNGGEFLNDDLINFAGRYNVTINMTAANAPWQNGIVERHHATADTIIEKLLIEDPSLDRQEAINEACLAKNSEVNKSGCSALQLVSGKSPTYPGLSDQTPATSNFDNANKYLKCLKNIDKIRVMYRQIDCDKKF